MVNGSAQLHLGGLLNHRRGQGEEMLQAFRRIGEVAPGSYGLLYVHDDEDPAGRENEFQVFMLRRGKISVDRDRYLSPCIPNIDIAEQQPG
jgi:hypothetical protein